MVSVFLYLVDFREEATPYELGTEIFPEVQFADTGTEEPPALSLAVCICTLTEEGGAVRLGGHAHIRYPCDLTYKTKKQILRLRLSINTVTGGLKTQHFN